MSLRSWVRNDVAETASRVRVRWRSTFTRKSVGGIVAGIGIGLFLEEAARYYGMPIRNEWKLGIGAFLSIIGGMIVRNDHGDGVSPPVSHPLPPKDSGL